MAVGGGRLAKFHFNIEAGTNGHLPLPTAVQPEVTEYSTIRTAARLGSSAAPVSA